MTDLYSVRDALCTLGVTDGDILLFHSSLKSFGYIEGGADAVIDGALLAVGDCGTLVAPTLVQRDFANAYKNWDKNRTPSDVGRITEVFRKRPEALRSDQATHSVAAIGPMAKFLTEGHTARRSTGTTPLRKARRGKRCMTSAARWSLWAPPSNRIPTVTSSKRA